MLIKDGSYFSVSNMQKNYKPKPLTFTCQPADTDFNAEKLIDALKIKEVEQV